MINKIVESVTPLRQLKITDFTLRDRFSKKQIKLICYLKIKIRITMRFLLILAASLALSGCINVPFVPLI